MSPLDDCCYTCIGPCGHVVCRDQAPSPGETTHTCGDCWPIAQALTEWGAA